MILTDFYYPHEPIATIKSLALFLGVDIEDLNRGLTITESAYRIADEYSKPDGSTRTVYDTSFPLKGIQKTISAKIFKRVQYPSHLQGGLEGCDYVSNCKIHTKKAELICIDISNFFPSIKEDKVRRLWLDFFCFSPEVAECLTKLTTYKGFVPQGVSTSSYIANLLFWKEEKQIVEYMERNNLFYSRYIDDITISSKRKLSKSQKTAIIDMIYGMMLKKGVKPNRRKFEIKKSHKNMSIHGVNVNSRKPSLPDPERSEIRNIVHKVENDYSKFKRTPEYKKKWNSASGKVGKLKRFHEADKLRSRLRAVKPPA